MTFIDDCRADDRDQRDEKTRQDIYETQYLDGQTDAAFGQLPRYADPGYLEGYVTKLQQLPKDEAGRIIHYSPTQHFAFGWVDTPDPCYYNEDF
ncbi:hypothetical protein ACKFKF_34105 [Phormidesmis sp. 146-12]